MRLLSATFDFEDARATFYSKETNVDWEVEVISYSPKIKAKWTIVGHANETTARNLILKTRSKLT